MDIHIVKEGQQDTYQSPCYLVDKDCSVYIKREDNISSSVSLSDLKPFKDVVAAVPEIPVFGMFIDVDFNALQAPCYVVGKNGVFLKLSDTAIIKISSIPTASEVSKYTRIKVPKIPLSIYGMVLDFFRKVDEEHHSEAVVLLTLENGKLDFAVPKQVVGMMSVKEYDRTLMNTGVVVGTIHSHQSAGAFQSGTDKADEFSFNGLHITFGKINDSVIDIHARFINRNNHFEITPTSALFESRPVLEDYTLYRAYIDKEARQNCMAEFMRNVTKEVYVPSTTVMGSRVLDDDMWYSEGGYNRRANITYYSPPVSNSNTVVPSTAVHYGKTRRFITDDVPWREKVGVSKIITIEENV